MLEGLFDADRWSTTFQNMGPFWEGFGVTLQVVVAGLLLSLVLGTLLGVFSTTRSRVLRAISRVYVEFYQNTPLPVQVLFMYMAGPQFLQAITGADQPVRIAPFVLGFLGVGLYHAAYISEVIRTGIEAVPRGQMEADDLHAPEDLKAKLLAMTDQLTEEEKAQPMMKTAAPVPAQSAPVQPKKKLIRFPAKRVGALAACLAVCVVGYGAFATGQIGLGAKSSSPAVYYSADSTAAAMAAGGADRAAVDSPMAADYSLNTMALESGADNGTAVYSEDDAAAAAHSTDHAKIIYTANLSLESKDYDAARAALDAALAEAGGYLESSSEYSDAGDSRSVSLTYRVPQQNYENFLAAVAEAGNVTYKNQQADDVTAQYMDVETRLENLKNQRTRLQQLQQQADNLSDLLEIESSLTDVQSQIESWQSQMDWYNDQVEECTVYVSLSEVSTYSPPSEGFGSRFVSALSAGWQNFVGGLQQVIVALAGAWPVVVIAAAACAGFVVWKKKKK